MIADLKPYPAYRETGLPWLGKVPEHWGLVRIKTVLRESDSRSTDGTATLLSLTRNRGLIPHREMTDKQHSAKTLIGYKCYKSGQIVMNRMQAWSGMFGSGAICGLVSPDYAVFDILGGHVEKFILERLKTQDLVAQFALESKGIGSGFNRLYTDRFGSIPISLPPHDEQVAIMHFLNWANGQLEKAIRAKRKVITLLNEQKQAIIHRAVTRGLDPSVPLKPSGIPWLGDIPEHWEVRKLRTLFHTQGSGTTPSGDHYYGGSINWVMSGDLNDSVIKKTKRTVHGKALIAYSTLKLYPDNSIVVAMYGATIGKTGILGVAACTNQACCVFAQAMPTVNVFLIQLIIQTAKPHLLRAAYGGGQPNINADVVRSLRIPFPPIKEQDAILAHVELETSRLTTAISRFEREIELLREYRTRLVADVVTGKLDVREAAAKLPDEALIDLPDNDSVEALEDEPFEEEALV